MDGLSESARKGLEQSAAQSQPLPSGIVCSLAYAWIASSSSITRSRVFALPTSRMYLVNPVTFTCQQPHALSGQAQGIAKDRCSSRRHDSLSEHSHGLEAAAKAGLWIVHRVAASGEGGVWKLPNYTPIAPDIMDTSRPCCC
uniref:Uncharacterized protein n=1 Tax=Coccidioides posadasii RMSCC 3488 TaxID=454284 RepID=A0A0J6ILN6_COCPO|nr:hypothetical protein CPAG_09134 [Coccidioides posadasii RMSCC 3488]